MNLSTVANRYAILKANSALDICLLVGYCGLILGILPAFVMMAWGIDALSQSPKSASKMPEIARSRHPF